ncbi:MAG: tyrosine-type recombinase/integrase [Clostridia bacterium]|nr:tyrosine-type recombinase/integrase [Clostridia bacterium]
MERSLDCGMLNSFESYLRQEERSQATVSKYLRDVRAFFVFLADRPLKKEVVVEYKNQFLSRYAVASANSMIAALNSFLRFLNWHDLCVRQFKVQRSAFCSEDKELTKAEYMRLIEAAKQKGNERLSLILQTICGSGIRVSELQYITVDAVIRGEAFVSCKGKNRRVFIVAELKKKLLRYVSEQRIRSGAIFITRNGRPISRHNIWRDMKSLCKQANVSPSKVFPHNLRHLFARTFYGIEKDIAKLADILGHASINTTRIYIATTGTEHKRKMENMRLIL